MSSLTDIIAMTKHYDACESSMLLYVGNKLRILTVVKSSPHRLLSYSNMLPTWLSTAASIGMAVGPPLVTFCKHISADHVLNDPF